MHKLTLLSAAIALALGATASQAAVITFDTAPTGSFNGSVTEAGFTYATSGGGLWVAANGNPGNDMEGNYATNGGVLLITAATPNTQFTFQGLDYAAPSTQSIIGPASLYVAGFLGGNSVASDLFNNISYTQNSSYNWTSEIASNLAGVKIDTLLIELTGSSFNNGSYQHSTVAVDNIKLTLESSSVPEPSAIALIAAGVAGVSGFRRRRKA